MTDDQLACPYCGEDILALPFDATCRALPRCDARHPVSGHTFTCHFDHGHQGMHHDPTTGEDWRTP